MSVAREYPEKPPENLRPFTTRINPLGQVWTMLHDSQEDTQYGNRIESQIMGLDSVAAAFTQHIEAGQNITATYAHALIRQTEAWAILKGLVFESINHAHGHTKAFVNREPLERMGETMAEAVWRTKMANHVLSSDGMGIVVPNFSSGINVQVAPLIHTYLPGDERSGQAGYIDPKGKYADINEVTSEGKISLSAAQAFSVPILGKVEKDYRIESSDENFSATDDPSYYRNHDTQLLVNMYQSAVGEELTEATVVDAVAVLPGISKVGDVGSLDFLVNLGTNDYSAHEPDHPDYWVELVHDGIPQGGRVINGDSDRRLGALQDSRFLHFPTLAQTLPAQPKRPFTRDKEDGTISILAIPIASTSSPDKRFNLVETSPSDDDTVYLQPSRNYAPILTHISLVGSY